MFECADWGDATVRGVPDVSGAHQKLQSNGVAGWLLLFIITRVVIGPPWNAFRIYQRWEGLEAKLGAYAQSREFVQLQQSAWLLYGAATAISISTGLLLVFKRRPSSVWAAIFGLWIAGLVLPILGYIYALYVTGEPTKFSDILFMVLPILSAGFWTAYLFLSKRVKDSFGFHPRLAVQSTRSS